MTVSLYLTNCGVITPLGWGKQAVAKALFEGCRDGLVSRDDIIPDRKKIVGAVSGELPALPPDLTLYDSRNNRLLDAALTQISPSIEDAVRRYGRDRVAVVLGTSTSGISDGESALVIYRQTGAWPNNFDYRRQETGSPAAFTSRRFGITGPAYTVATACSSSTKVFASGRRLIAANLADAVIVGGADTLCRTTLSGFGVLEALSKGCCNPFSANRDGITIGEGAAVFLLERERGPVKLLGIGETSDGYHATAPDPEGNGACQAMLQALADANLMPEDICYINLHGTGTLLNDAMESKAVASIFSDKVPCSSTKGMTGHMLGAAGGCEAAFLWLTLNPETNPTGTLPPHLWDGARDPVLPQLNLIPRGTRITAQRQSVMLSNSFGFGGSNASLILGHTNG